MYVGGFLICEGYICKYVSMYVWSWKFGGGGWVKSENEVSFGDKERERREGRGVTWGEGGGMKIGEGGKRGAGGWASDFEVGEWVDGIM